MRTERVTFLASREQKDALDAFASSRGESVGNVVREATSRYMAQPANQKDEHEEALELLLPVLETMLPKWNRQMDSMEASIRKAREAIDRALAGDAA
jgi:tRNA G26 N,N-dimethylase Trm1